MNMQIPTDINLFGLNLPVFIIFILLGLLFSFYAVWREGRKDGFDQEKLFDNYILTLLAGLIFGRIFFGVRARFLLGPFLEHVFYFWRPGVSVDGFIVGFLLGTLGFSRLYKWSFFRISDIFSLAFCFGSSLLLLGLFALGESPSYLLFFGGCLLFYGALSQLRLKRLFSGAVFLIFLVLLFLTSFLTDLLGQADLLFGGFLLTIGMLSSIWRLKKTMTSKRNLPASFINKIKDTLQSKDKSLKAQQRLLEEEDPYMQEGRAEGNSDDVDEAHLEDNRKNLIDAQKGLVSSISKAVKKALGKIDKGEYGICDSCGDAIDSARLEAYPETSLCSTCARRSEQG
jgi:RNA polymerase-binding transcription factor DksA